MNLLSTSILFGLKEFVYMLLMHPDLYIVFKQFLNELGNSTAQIRWFFSILILVE